MKINALIRNQFRIASGDWVSGAAALEPRMFRTSPTGHSETINWSVQPGEHWTILGPNDSGKTTLLKLASGYLWPNAGGIVLRKGKELTYSPELRKKHRLVDRIVGQRNSVAGKSAQPWCSGNLRKSVTSSNSGDKRAALILPVLAAI